MTLNHVLGKVPMIQVLDFMMSHIEYDISIKEIIEYTGVGPTDMKRDFPGLVECGVVTETRKIGGVQLYRLNDTNVVTEELFELDRVLSAGREEEEPEPIDFGAIVGPDDPKKYPESEEEWTS